MSEGGLAIMRIRTDKTAARPQWLLPFLAIYISGIGRAAALVVAAAPPPTTQNNLTVSAPAVVDTEGGAVAEPRHLRANSAASAARTPLPASAREQRHLSLGANASASVSAVVPATRVAAARAAAAAAAAAPAPHVRQPQATLLRRHAELYAAEEEDRKAAWRAARYATIALVEAGAWPAVAWLAVAGAPGDAKKNGTASGRVINEIWSSRSFLGLPKVFWALAASISMFLVYVACMPFILTMAKRRPRASGISGLGS